MTQWSDKAGWWPVLDRAMGLNIAESLPDALGEEEVKYIDGGLGGFLQFHKP